MNRLLGVVAAVLLGTSLAACTSESDSSSMPSVEPSRAAVSETVDLQRAVDPAWRLDQMVVGQPVVVEEVAIAVVSERPTRYQVVGVDVATGDVRWRHPYLVRAGSGAPIASPVATDVDGTVRVVFQTPTDKSALETGRRPLLFVDPATGRVRDRTEPISVLEPMQACPVGPGVCLTYFDGVQPVVRRVGLRDASAKRVVATGDGSYADGPDGLFLIQPEIDRDSERIGRQVGQRLLWRRPSSEFWAGRTLQFDPTISFDEAGDRYVVAAQTYRDADAVSGRRYTVSFRASTGRILWSADGVTTCPGVDPSTPVRCRLTDGIVHLTSDGHPVLRGLAMDVEGYDPADGRTTWTHEVDARSARSAYENGDYVIPGSQTEMVTTTSTGPVRIDLTDGGTRPVEPDEVLACARARLIMIIGRSELNPRYAHTHPGGRLHYPCRPDGRPAPSWTPASLAIGGVDAGEGRYVVATEDGLLGFAT